MRAIVAEHDEISPGATIVIHSCNDVGGARMFDILIYDSRIKREILRIPFTTLIRLGGLTRILGLQEEQD